MIRTALVVAALAAGLLTPEQAAEYEAALG
jgi:hypothetical protein